MTERRSMDRTQALRIEPGDYLEPDPAWNKSERYDKLPARVQVLEVQYGPSQLGVMVLVQTVRRGERWLSAGWFLEPAQIGPHKASEKR